MSLFWIVFNFAKVIYFKIFGEIIKLKIMKEDDSSIKVDIENRI